MTFKKGNIPWNKGLTKWADERELQKNKEKIKEQQRKYQQRPEVKLRRKEYRKKNKDKIKTKSREFEQRPERKARKKKNMEKYRKKNKERIAKQKKEYRRKNEDKIKEYYQRPEVKEKRKEYYQKNKERLIKQRKEYEQRPGVKEKISQRKKEYNQRPERKAKKKEYRQRLEVRTKQNTHNRKRRKEDSNYAICRRVRENFKDALKTYSTTGKVMSTSEYLDMKAIIKKLTPFPEPRENYHIDHIIPLVMFDHNDQEQVRRAWLPENLQWLPKEINLWKGDRLIIPMTQEQQDKLLKRLKKEQKS